MPTTRTQAAALHKKQQKGRGHAKSEPQEEHDASTCGKRVVEEKTEQDEAEPPTKRNKGPDNSLTMELHPVEQAPQTGTIERGHIYFFYRPKVQYEEAHDLDDVKNLHMLLVPRPPKFSENDKLKVDRTGSEDAEMMLLMDGADARPAKATVNATKKKYRLVTIGKKQLPDPDVGEGKGRMVFWAAVTAVGDDLDSLERGLGERSYETKTRGTRHEEPARLAARGAYAIVNNDPSTPSKRATHLGYYISHPDHIADVQQSLGIQKASSFVLQVKNPLAPATEGQRGLPPSKRADYPDEIMQNVFGRGTKGREEYGLRFVSCERIEMLDYEDAELLLIAAHGDKEGLDTGLGEGRGRALQENEDQEATRSVDKVFKELALKPEDFPQDALEGGWI